jgi:RNA polymerase sigma-70 factor (ECF subfamily)
MGQCYQKLNSSGVLSMSDPSALRTRASLLARLRDPADDQAAWELFVDRYGPKIYGWCRYWGLQEADAEDVTQTVMLKLAEKLRSFEYDRTGSFRAWLKTLTQHAWADFLDGQRRHAQATGDSRILDRLNAVETREDLETRLAATFDLELLEAAGTRVQQRVEPHTWSAYQLTAVEQVPASEAAAQLGISVVVVYQARSKVQKMLQDEVKQLTEADFQ